MRTKFGRFFAIVSLASILIFTSHSVSAVSLTMTSDDVLEVRFSLPIVPFGSPNLFSTSRLGGQSFVVPTAIISPFTSSTASLFDGDTLLGSYTFDSTTRLFQGFWAADGTTIPPSCFCSFPIPPTFVVFSSILDGSIDGLVRYSIDSGEVTFESDNLLLGLSTVNPDGSVGSIFVEQPTIISTFVVSSIDVAIDIKPQSCPNPLNVKSKGVLPVAILGTADLDVTDIDITSLRLNGVAPVKSGFENVATTTGFEPCDCLALSGDGSEDLTLKFDTQAIVAVLQDVQNGEEIPLMLTGMLQDGTAIEGIDCVVIKGVK